MSTQATSHNTPSNLSVFPYTEEQYEEMREILDGENEETEAEIVARIQSTPLTTQEKIENFADIFEDHIDGAEIEEYEIGFFRFTAHRNGTGTNNMEKFTWSFGEGKDPKATFENAREVLIQSFELENERENIELDFSFYNWD